MTPYRPKTTAHRGTQRAYGGSRRKTPRGFGQAQ